MLASGRVSAAYLIFYAM